MNKMRDTKIEWVDVFPTTRCNMKCTYCFYKQGGEDMSPKAAIEYLEAMQGKFRKNLLINFFGGEPLLNPETLVAVIEHFKSKDVRFGLCTNGTIFSEKLFRFFLDNKVSIQISIDGTEKTHNQCRGNHALIVENVKRMFDMGYPMSARLTYSPENVADLAENIAYAHNLGFNRIMHHGVIEAKWDKESVEEYKQQIKRIMDFWAQHSKLEILYIDRILTQTDLPCGHKAPCGAGSTMVALMPNGDIYPCHRLASGNKFKLGNAKTGIARGIFLDIKRDDITGCRDCRAKKSCHTCLAANYEGNGSLFDPVKPFCEIIKTEFDVINQVKKRAKEMKMENESKVTLDQKIDRLIDMMTKLSAVVLDLAERIEAKDEKK
jgi:uncharacterized protein